MRTAHFYTAQRGLEVICIINRPYSLGDFYSTLVAWDIVSQASNTRHQCLEGDNCAAITTRLQCLYRLITGGGILACSVLRVKIRKLIFVSHLFDVTIRRKIG